MAAASRGHCDRRCVGETQQSEDVKLHLGGQQLTVARHKRGVLSLAALESAVAQPYMAFGGQELYPSLADKAAALAFSLIQNHAFVDGNKRVGHVALETFLVLNGCAAKARTSASPIPAEPPVTSARTQPGLRRVRSIKRQAGPSWFVAVPDSAPHTRNRTKLRTASHARSRGLPVAHGAGLLRP